MIIQTLNDNMRFAVPMENPFIGSSTTYRLFQEQHIQTKWNELVLKINVILRTSGIRGYM